MLQGLDSPCKSCVLWGLDSPCNEEGLESPGRARRANSARPARATHAAQVREAMHFLRLQACSSQNCQDAAASTMYTALCRAGEAQGLYLSSLEWRFAVLPLKQKYLARPRPLSNIEAMKAMKAMKKKCRKPSKHQGDEEAQGHESDEKDKEKSLWQQWLGGLESEKSGPCRPLFEPGGRSSDEDLPATEKPTQTPPWIRRLRRARNLDDLQYAGHDSYNLGRTLHVL